MNRLETAKCCQEIASNYAKEFSFNSIRVGANRLEEGVDLNSYLESEYGSDAYEENILFEKVLNKPVEGYADVVVYGTGVKLSVRLDEEVFCSIVFSDVKKNGYFDIDEIKVTSRKGLSLQERIIKEWNSCLAKSKVMGNVSSVVVGGFRFETKNSACWYYGLSYSKVYNHAKKNGFSFEESILDLVGKQYKALGLGFNTIKDIGIFFGLDKFEVEKLINNEDGLSFNDAVNCWLNSRGGKRAELLRSRAEAEIKRREMFVLEVVE